MAHKTYKIILTDKSWHGHEDAVVSRDIPVHEGCELAKMSEVVWETRPAYAEVQPGLFIPVEGKKVLVRLPNSWDNTFHTIGNRLVKDYQIVDNGFLCGLASKMAEVTGWKFEGAGTLSKGEMSFIQLRLNEDFNVAGRKYEAHKAMFMFGDDKRGGSGYGGLVFTRIQCWNTWRMAAGEDGVFKIPHRDDPHAQWEFVNARVEAAIAALKNQNAILDKFFVTALARRDFNQFLENAIPTPSVPKAIVEAEEARAMLEDGLVKGDKLAHILFRGDRAQNDYESKYALVERRREAVERAYDTFNAGPSESKETLYSAFNGLTWVANHGDTNVFRGNSTTGVLFNGARGQFVDKGYNVLKSMLEAQ